jgi:hypothetical protein
MTFFVVVRLLPFPTALAKAKAFAQAMVGALCGALLIGPQRPKSHPQLVLPTIGKV